MSRITKENLVEVLAKKVCCSKKEAVDCLNLILEEIKGHLKKGQDVVLTGFGTFVISHRKARIGRNPQTGASLKIPARNVVRFKVSKTLKDAVK